MKLWLFIFCGLVLAQSAVAEFNDPMRPPAYALEKLRLAKLKNKVAVISPPVKPVKKESWVLNSILFSSQRQHAIINNKLVKKGDTISGAKLIALNPDSVQLLSKGKVIKLRIYEPDKNFKSIKKSLIENKL